MNTERLSLLAEHIAKLPETRFDMSIVAGRNGEDDVTLFGIDLDTDCGTAGCIAGWACALFAPDRRTSTWLAQQLLGLTDNQADRLFFPKNFKPLSQITKYDAWVALSSLASRGEPTWH